MADPATDAMAAESPMTADPTLRALSTPRPDTSRDDALIRDVKESQDRSRQIFAQGQQDIAPFRSQALKQLGSPHPAPPQFERVPQMETKQEGSAIEGWMTVLLPLAALASARGRNASTDALVATTGALTGVHQNNREAFEQNFKVLKANQEAIVQNNTQLQQQYMDILNDRKLSTQEMMSAVQLVAGANQDQLAMEAATRGDTIQLAQLIDKRDQGAALLAERWARVEKAEREARGDGGLTPEAVKALVDRVGEQGMSALSGLSRNKEDQRKVMNEIATRNWPPDKIKQATLAMTEQQSGARALGTIGARFGVFSNEASQMMQVALDESEKFPRGQFPPLNQAINAYKAKTGDPQVQAFGFAVLSLSNTYAKVLNPTGVPRLQDKVDARLAGLNSAQTPEQFLAVITIMAKEIDATKAGVDITRQEIGGKGGERPTTLESIQNRKPQQGAPQDGATATNPQTGQKIILRGGQWVPMQ